VSTDQQVSDDETAVETEQVAETQHQQKERLSAEEHDALERVAKDDVDGLIQPEMVVEMASDPASPLHKHFEWDDGKAAHAHRIAQARYLIARYTITRIDEGPKYVNITIRKDDGSSRRGYVAVERAVADPDLCGQIMADAKRGIVAYRNRLSAFERSRAVVGALDEAIGRIDEVVQDLSEAA
jgi:hypothetical protein